MTDLVRVFPLAPVSDLCPEPSLGVEVGDVVAVVSQYLESAGIQVYLAANDLEAAKRQAAILLGILGVGSADVFGAPDVRGALTERRWQ